jgi:hypothetical protein
MGDFMNENEQTPETHDTKFVNTNGSENASYDKEKEIRAENTSQRKRLLPVLKLWKESFHMYTRHLPLYLGLFYFPLIIALIALSIAFAVWYWIAQVYSASMFLLPIIVVILISMTMVLIYTTLYFVIANHETRYRFYEIYKKSTPSIPSLLWIGVLSFLIIFGGFLLLFIPGVLVSVWIAFSGFVYFKDQKKGFQAVKQSREYVRGYWWPVFCRLVLLWIVLFIVNVLVHSILKSVAPDTLYMAYQKMFDLLVSSFATPFTLVYLSLIYKNLRTIKNAKGDKAEVLG